MTNPSKDKAEGQKWVLDIQPPNFSFPRVSLREFVEMTFDFTKGQTKQTKRSMSVLLKIIGTENDTEGNESSVQNR